MTNRTQHLDNTHLLNWVACSILNAGRTPKKTKRTQNVIPNACEGPVKIGNFLNFDICSLIFDMILNKQTQFQNRPVNHNL
jgi:hypothetical protein